MPSLQTTPQTFKLYTPAEYSHRTNILRSYTGIIVFGRV